MATTEPKTEGENNTEGEKNETITEDIYVKEKIYTVPFKNEIGEQNSYFIVIMHLFHFTKEINDFLTQGNFEYKKDIYVILQDLKDILCKYDENVIKANLTQTQSNATENKEKEEMEILDINKLRDDVQNLFLGEEFFKKGKSGEPSDILFFFLNAFHSYTMNANSLKYSIPHFCNPKCPSHMNFYCNAVKQFECKGCNATSDAFQYDNNYYIHEIKVKDLLEKIEGNNLNDFKGQFFYFQKEIEVRNILILFS